MSRSLAQAASGSRSRRGVPASRLTAHRLWLGLFLVWLVFLSGLFAGLGAPGILQAVRLKRLLREKETLQERLQTDIVRLQAEAEALERDPAAQKREIRKVLGYTTEDELIFDFNRPSSL